MAQYLRSSIPHDEDMENNAFLTSPRTQRKSFSRGSMEITQNDDDERFGTWNVKTSSLIDKCIDMDAKLDRPQTLDHGHRRFWSTAISLAAVAITLPLFAFGGYALSLQGKKVDARVWEHYQGVSRKLATVFPILFASVLGWGLRKVAQWKLERGSSLNSLERLIGSYSVGATLITQGSMGFCNFLGISLLLIWCLSPLGSQASLQALSVRPHRRETTMEVRYFDFASTPGFSSNNLEKPVPLDALFSSCLMSPQFSHSLVRSSKSNQDAFNNVLIPDFGLLSNTSDPVHTNDTGWLHIPFSAGLHISSALGIPASISLHENNKAIFTLETSYIALSCSNKSISFGDGGIPYIPLNGDNSDLFNRAKNGTLANDTYYGYDSNTTFSISLNSFYQQEPYGNVWDLLNDTSTYEPRTLLFQSQNNASNSSVTSVFCTATTAYVESEVSCLGSLTNPACVVKAMRPSQQPHPNSNLTNLGYIGAFTTFSQYLQAASTVKHGTSSALELYIQDSSLEALGGGPSADLSNISTRSISTGLQKAINAYWYGSYDPVMFMSGSGPLMTKVATGVHSHTMSLYRIDVGWILIYFIASFGMFLGAVIGAILSFKTQAPEVLGYCSSLIKENPYVQGSKMGSAMTGYARSRYYRYMRLKLVDVEPEKAVGYVAIAEDDDGARFGPLKAKKLYR